MWGGLASSTSSPGGARPSAPTSMDGSDTPGGKAGLIESSIHGEPNHNSTSTTSDARDRTFSRRHWPNHESRGLPTYLRGRGCWDLGVVRGIFRVRRSDDEGHRGEPTRTTCQHRPSVGHHLQRPAQLPHRACASAAHLAMAACGRYVVAMWMPVPVRRVGGGGPCLGWLLGGLAIWPCVESAQNVLACSLLVGPRMRATSPVSLVGFTSGFCSRVIVEQQAAAGSPLAESEPTQYSLPG